MKVWDGSTWVDTDAVGLIDVKSVTKTDTFSASVAAGANVAVTDLSITHEVSDPSNKLIITAIFGIVASNAGRADVGIAIHDGTSLIAVGDTAGSRSVVGAGGPNGGATSVTNTANRAVSFVHVPGAGSKTYTVRAVNIEDNTRTLYINRTDNDGDFASRSRSASSLVIQEVSV